MMQCGSPKNIFCSKCTCLYWIKGHQVQVCFWFCAFEAGKLTFLLAQLPHFSQILVKHIHQEKHSFWWYHQLYQQVCE